MFQVPSLLIIELGRRFLHTTRQLYYAQEHAVNKSRTLYSTSPETVEIKLSEVRRFMEESLKASGAPDEAAAAQANVMISAECMGHKSHGLNRLEYYVNDCLSGACTPAAVPSVLMETLSTAWVDGNNALGATVAKFCMDLAITKAKATGMGWVAAKRCNHFGMGSYWTQLAEGQGLIGLALSNTSPVMVPTRSSVAAIGTNPISYAAPGFGGDRLVVDMATTAVAKGKIELQARKGEKIPLGWALDENGRPTTDAKAALKSGKLMPLGGDESNSGFKGFALSAMIETLTSGLSGSKATHNIKVWSLKSDGTPRDLGQCFGAINPCCFAPGFYQRVSDCLNTWRSLKPLDPSKPVIVPGDLERSRLRKTRYKDTVSYTRKELDDYANLAKKFKVKPLLS